MRFFNNLAMGYAQTGDQYSSDPNVASGNTYTKETSSTNHSYFEKKGEVNDIRKSTN